jgi:hypothetical protein
LKSETVSPARSREGRKAARHAIWIFIARDTPAARIFINRRMLFSQVGMRAVG